MITLEQKYTLKRAIEEYGPDIQKIIAIEELSELQKEITKSFRGKGNIKEVIEEIADVYIMLEQLTMIYNIGSIPISDMISFKIKRLTAKLNTFDLMKGKNNEKPCCKNCKHLMFSDCYGECSKAYKGIVNPDDSCEHFERRIR